MAPPRVCHASAGSVVIVVCLLLYGAAAAAAAASSSPSSAADVMRLRKHHNSGSGRKQAKKGLIIQANLSSCALFQGAWVRDDTYPMYQSSDCAAIIDPEFNCQAYGRPDSDYLKYRWKPLNCELPRFNGMEFLRRMRGKSVMFVGDSLGRNQWESLICMISAAAPSRSPTQILRGDPLSTFVFLEYGVSISFYRAPYLVDVDGVQGKRVLKLEDISRNAKSWLTADVLSFNTGHWWTHKGSLQGWDVMEMGGTYFEDMDRLVALERGLRTWSNWVDSNLDPTRTSVFFQSISPTHYNPSEWSAGTTATATKNCYGETVPVSGSTYPGAYPQQMKVLSSVIKDMKTPTYLLDITMLSALRKDGHPSIYSGDLTPEQRSNPDRSSDCSHWCLPGLPDTWNQLFYTAVLL
ncbi:protein PMR5-like isoform X2 [Punica granatum]|uniref:Protein PMR5-like isoform X2 n=2 Tax=Punica granatum TaxID=22663 RepID=A0A6P8E5N9_PUNGR|nr:protein PMR5-like isoform X2 [Punica granatum]XP_031400701.1 protein PMR5-like isoform X2 [Punica granatum]